MSQSYAGNAGTSRIEPKPPSERLSLYCSNLDDLAKAFHDQASRLESLADRILGPVPEAVSANSATPAPQSITGRFEAVTDVISAASQRIRAVLNRLETL